MFSRASGFSIFAIIGILKSEFLLIKPASCSTSFLVLTKERAIQSKRFSIANNASFSSLSVNAGIEILVLGRLTPFFGF